MYSFLSMNPNIFTVDYKILTQQIFDTGLAEGIIMERFSPKNMGKFVHWGYDEFKIDE
jgi:hypothetical protein